MYIVCGKNVINYIFWFINFYWFIDTFKNLTKEKIIYIILLFVFYNLFLIFKNKLIWEFLLKILKALIKYLGIFIVLILNKISIVYDTIKA